MRKDITRFIGILIIILFFGYFIYPTPFYYSYEIQEVHMIVKINRFTGTAYFLNPQTKVWDVANK